MKKHDGLDLYNLQAIPPGVHCQSAAVLCEYAIDKMHPGFIVGVYWYAVSAYEGQGYMLYRMTDREGWYLLDMSHCSCDYPTEHFGEAAWSHCRQWLSLSKLQDEATPELWGEIKGLVRHAYSYEQEGYFDG